MLLQGPSVLGEGAAGFDVSLRRGRRITVGTGIPLLGGFFVGSHAVGGRSSPLCHIHHI